MRSSLFEPQATSHAQLLSLRISQSSIGTEDHASVPEKLARTMREMILQGQLRPGDPLVESRMARDLSVGQPTVREAFKELELEGLVQRTRNRGCSVVKLGQAEVDAMSRLRVEVEVMAVKELCRAWTVKIAAVLEEALSNMRLAARAGSSRAYLRADLEFHEAIWRLGGNPYVERIAAPVTVPLFVLAMSSPVEQSPKALLENLAGHEAIFEALKTRDELSAVLVVRQVLEGFWEQDLSTARKTR